jgi:methionyl-tRNA formyltransferase
MFGDPATDTAGRRPFVGSAPNLEGLFLPDLDVALGETCSLAGWETEHCACGDINHEDISRHLEAHRPRLVVYSGYAGQLVKPHVLDLGFDFLHLHAGWLPDYKGSTTIYYSWLREGHCGVTALILDHDIHAGPIIARRRYPAPPQGVDVDLVYDSAIRADLLVEVLKDYGELETLRTQPNTDEGQTYYVIHPVLKHLALLSREAPPPPLPAPPERLEA